MTDPRAARRRALFDAADALPREARTAWLRAHAADDPALAAEVLDLLALADDEAADDDGGDDTADRWIGRTIGPYALERLVGLGGMGAVFEARRADAEFERRVAIKLIRRGVDGELAVRRFRAERQILAGLRHPHIATLLDGGLTTDGQPWLAMEFVDGQPITAWADAQGLDVAARVRLLLQVVAALEHAHGRLVVHRDLKPGNILVDADRSVRLLDFGIARLLDEAGDATPATEAGARAFTPAYASPEQFLGLPAQLASDVYSLGAVAYELLAGRRPHDLAGLTLGEAQHRVCRTDPPRPSRVAPAPRARALAGDLDAIVLQALARDPDRRYGSVGAFGADLQAWLDHRPVRARRATPVERTRRFLRRRPVESAAVVVVAAVLMAATVVSHRAATVAEREQARATQVSGFLTDLLASADPDIGGREVPVTALLAQAARRLDQEAPAPAIAAELRHTLAQSYYALGQYDSAAVQARTAHALRLRTDGVRHPRTAEVVALQAVIAEAQGDNARADSLIGAAVTALRAAVPVDARRLADALDHQSRIASERGRLDEAERLLEEEIALRRASADSAARTNLPTALANLAVSWTYRGRLAQAESLQRVALREAVALGGRDRPATVEVERGLADLLEARGRFAQADTILRRVVPALERQLGTTHPTALRARAAQARLRVRMGDYAGALEVARPVVEAIDGPLPASDPTAASVLQFVGAAHDSLGRFAEGETALRRAWALRQRAMPAGHWAIASAEATVGAHLLRVGRLEAARPLLERGYAGVAAVQGATAPYATQIAQRLVLLHEARGDRAAVARWRARADTTPP